MEMAAGIFILTGIVIIGYMLVELGGMKLSNGGNYSLFARFESVSGLKIGGSVRIAGVEIGKVGSISLDTALQVALVRLDVKKEVELDEDVIASVKTSGLIGDKYISLLPGGSDEILVSGDNINQTESAIDIEGLLGKYVFGDVKD